MERMKAILVLTATLAFVTSPLFSGAFGGFAADRFPVPQNDPPVQPAGYAFSIWGLIYGWLLVHAVFGLLRRDTDAAWDAPRWPLILSLAVGASWIPVALINPVWATVLIWVMLIAALAALFGTASRPDRWLLQAPVAIYAGWLTAASFVALGVVGAGYGVLTGSTGWAWIALLAALALAAAVQLRLRRAPEYGVTVAWALVAVAVTNWGQDWALTALACAGAVLMGWLGWRVRTPV